VAVATVAATVVVLGEKVLVDVGWCWLISVPFCAAFGGARHRGVVGKRGATWQRREVCQAVAIKKLHLFL
jgi:hypothetical protein